MFFASNNLYHYQSQAKKCKLQPSMVLNLDSTLLYIADAGGNLLLLQTPKNEALVSHLHQCIRVGSREKQQGSSISWNLQLDYCLLLYCMSGLVTLPSERLQTIAMLQDTELSVWAYAKKSVSRPRRTVYESKGTFVGLARQMTGSLCLSFKFY